MHIVLEMRVLNQDCLILGFDRSARCAVAFGAAARAYPEERRRTVGCTPLTDLHLFLYLVYGSYPFPEAFGMVTFGLSKNRSNHSAISGNPSSRAVAAIAG